jgi:hypothetical protein
MQRGIQILEYQVINETSQGTTYKVIRSNFTQTELHADMHAPHTKRHTEYKLRIGQNTNQKTEIKDTISNSIFKDVSIIYVKVHSMSFKN